MKINIKSTIAIIIFILNIIISSCNFNFSAEKCSNGSNSLLKSEYYPLQLVNYKWSDMEVISEPVLNQDNNKDDSWNPKIAIENEKIYIVWRDKNDTNGAGIDFDIFFRYFDGFNWSKIQVISEPNSGYNYNTGNSIWPDIAVEDGKIFVVWQDNNITNNAGTDYDIFFRSNFTGNSWEDIQVISEPIKNNDMNIMNSELPKIDVENGKLYVVWQDGNNTNGAGTDSDIFYRCNITGSSWEEIEVISEPIKGLDTNTQWSGSPEITVENNKKYVGWSDQNNINGAGTDSDIFFICNLTGLNWENVQIISEPTYGSNINSGESLELSIAVETGKIYTTWHDYSNYNGAGNDREIFFRCNLTGLIWEKMQVISEPVSGKDFNNEWSESPEIAVENGNIFVVWEDKNNSNGAMFDWDIFLRYNLSGTNWEEKFIVSEPSQGNNFNSGSSSEPSIAIQGNAIYITWHDNNVTNNAGTDTDIFYRRTFIPPFLNSGEVTPPTGNTSTYFNFTVIYADSDNQAPSKINISIDGINYSMQPTNLGDLNYKNGNLYYCNLSQLPISNHIYQFWASDGYYLSNSTIYYGPNVFNTPPSIITVDNITAVEDIYYEVEYEYEDIDISNVGQTGNWDFKSNSTWLSFNPTTAILFGTPTNDDVGKYWINITINDTITIIHTNFTLNVINVNDDPIINISNIESIFEDEIYYVDYNASDIDSRIEDQIWSLNSNAESWLNIDSITGILSGLPSNNDVGSYWVNITVEDGDGGSDFKNFSLDIININDNPLINTTNIGITYEDEMYEIDYNATDVDSSISNQLWSLDTNATSWLNIDSTAGIVTGTPSNDEVGEYWLNVSVDDGDEGSAFTNFTLNVININDRPEIITEDELVANVNTFYFMDYNATDIDSPLTQFAWSLDTNATWLNIDMTSGILSGTPTIIDVGWYDVNITVNDGNGGQDWHDFILIVEKGNEPPEISTIDKVSITAGELYNIIYEATDDRTPLDSLIWSYNSNASWLSFNKLTRSLSGNPTLSHIGWYWVNVTVGDGEGGFDSHNFTVTVYATANQPPDILTDYDVNAVVGEQYSVDYEAEDDRTPIDKLHWSLETNTSDWLGIEPITGVLSGTPKLDDVGSYWVKVSVYDGEDGWDHNEFTLYVTTEPLTKLPPKLSNPSMTPSTGDTETIFTFSIDYSHPDGDLPDSIQVVIDGNTNNMESTNGHYEYSTKLSEGNHTYYFTTTLGNFIVNTDEYQTGYIDKSTDVEPDDGDGDEDNTMLYALVGIIVIIIIVLILLFIFLKKKKGKEEEQPVEEVQAPPPEEVPPEVPPEQIPTSEAPTPEQQPEIPPEQPPTPEVPPEQVPVTETPPEQPPTPEVTPQVPQVEPAPQPTPMPQVEEQPVPQPQVEPQVEQQPQVGVQEPAVADQSAEPPQQLVPKIKTQPTIEENNP